MLPFDTVCDTQSDTVPPFFQVHYFYEAAVYLKWLKNAKCYRKSMTDTLVKQDVAVKSEKLRAIYFCSDVAFL